MSQLITDNPMAVFLYAVKSPESKRQYPRRFKMFLDFLHLPGDLQDQAKEFLRNAKTNPKWVQDNLIEFISYQNERAKRGEISVSTIPNYYRATKLFCEMNDIVLVWKKIARGMERVRKAANDRAPTLEEIQHVIEYPDRRIKPIVFTMVSSGIRIGAWDYLRWKHISPVTNDEGEIVSAKLLVYAGDPEEYYTFLSPEAYKSLKEWMEFRASYGENITGESWVMRDIWQTTNITYGANLGLATCPKKLKSSGIKRLLERALWEQGIRHPLQNGAKRHEWKAAHGFRKFYKSRAEQVMRPINVEITMGHNIGVSESYYKPTEREVMEDYLKATDSLTICGDKIMLQKQVAELKEKTKDSEYVIRRRLEEKENEIDSIKRQMAHQAEQVNKIMLALQSNPLLLQIKPEVLVAKAAVASDEEEVTKNTKKY
jgi:integrase